MSKDVGEVEGNERKRGLGERNKGKGRGKEERKGWVHEMTERDVITL